MPIPISELKTIPVLGDAIKTLDGLMRENGSAESQKVVRFSNDIALDLKEALPFAVVTVDLQRLSGRNAPSGFYDAPLYELVLGIPNERVKMLRANLQT